MKYFGYIILVLFISCGASYTPAAPVNVPKSPHNTVPIPVAPKPIQLPVPDPTPVTPGDDWSPFFQKGIDSCIQNNIPVYFIPAGRYICKEPLILSNWQQSRGIYFNFSLVVQGTATFAGADGTGTILDFTGMTDGFGIGIQAGKGVEIKGIKLIGAFNYVFPGAYTFYNTSLQNFTNGKCRDTRYSPYFAIAIDPFGPSIPSDGGYPNLSQYYKGSTNGSTGTIIEDCYFTNWVGGLITSPNGQTANAEITVADKIQFGNMKICVAGCQDQEKMNRVSNVMAWGTIHTCFATGIYGAQRPGQWYFDHWNIAGYTQQIVINNEGGYYPSFFDNIYAESIGKIGYIATVNGTKFTNSSINFASYVETGSYTPDMISGYGVTFDGCQLRIYGQFTPITIVTGTGANNMHFRDCSFDAVPIYPQSYTAGYSDFQNCYIGAESPANILNPIGRSTPSIYAYPDLTNVAAKPVPVDNVPHKFSKDGAGFSSIIQSTGAVKDWEVILASTDNYTLNVAGIVAASSPGKFTISYSPSVIDTAKSYYLYHWVTNMR